VTVERLEAGGHEQGVARGREAAARHRRDDVDVLEERPGGAAGRRVRHGLERFPQPVGESGGARGGPAARRDQIRRKSTRKGLRSGRSGTSSVCVGGSTSARPPRRKTWDPSLTYSARGPPLAARVPPRNLCAVENAR